MERIRLILRFCWSICCVLGMATLVRGEEPADEKLQKLAEACRARAENIDVNVVIGDRKTKAKRHPNALMKYTDVPRRIEMATLWLWQDEGRPVALAKVEAHGRDRGGPLWVYCFASTSSELVESQWPDGRRFHAKEPGIAWTALNGSVPQETAAGRRRQSKEHFQRFSATARDETLKTSDELRLLARPLHEYSSPQRGVIQGVLCGLTAHGTNPDVLVALEAVRPAKDKDALPSWRYGVVCMTTSGVSVRLDKKEVFTRRYVRLPGDRDRWTWF